MFGLGKKKTTPPPHPAGVRAKLAAATADFGGAELAQRALAFFDDRPAFEKWCDEIQVEPRWVSDGDDPSEAEFAADILRELLHADGRAAYLDWADGVYPVLDVIDALFVRVGAPQIEAARREALIDMNAEVRRGKAVANLMDPIKAEATARGVEIAWWDTESDSYMPVVLAPGIAAKWRKIAFGKGFPVLP